ncbi:TetR/AcrR family transcriptional regulator [Klenkia sp. LSe6-5]|uniref:TetR/AcrR family transcriptional regulator n=1 Tax=Klenkia sesuvii TaxID=3103137 RepID=A0ABU8DQN2_9ACTN
MSTPAKVDRAGSKRRRLVEIGVQLLDEMPYADITITAITVRAGMTRGLFFYYFGDKDAYFDQVVAAFLDLQRARFAANDPQAADNPAAWLRAEIDAFLDIMDAHPQSMRTLMEQHWSSQVDDAGATMSDLTAARVTRAFALPEHDPVLRALLVSWGLHCVDTALRVQRTGTWDRVLVGAVLEAELHAVLATYRAPRTSV